MRTWLSSKYKEAPWLTAAVLLYLALSAIETTRNLVLADPPDKDDVGFSWWAEVAAPGSADKILLRWSGPSSTMYRPVEGTVLGLTVYRGEEAANLVEIVFSLDGKPLDAYAVGGGTYSFRYYMPAVLAPEKWSAAQTNRAERALVEAERPVGGWFANWQELKPWSLPPTPPLIKIETTLTPVPSPQSESETSVVPAVGIATVEWLDELHPDGAGFHQQETSPDGIVFRWTRRWASVPLRVAGAEAILQIRAIHPGIEGNPVNVTVFWDGDQRATTQLLHTEWTEVAVDLGAKMGAEGVLSLHVDRTWSPGSVGVSADYRELGVAFGDVAWR